MKKNQIFSGIFAAVFVATTTLIISSCSQDDDYYDTDMHTLAEKKMTRSGDPGSQNEDPRTLTISKNFYLGEKDSLTCLAQAQVQLCITYYKNLNIPGTVTYVSHTSSQNLENVRAKGDANIIRGILHWRGTVYADLTIQRDSLPDTTLFVQGKHEEYLHVPNL